MNTKPQQFERLENGGRGRKLLSLFVFGTLLSASQTVLAASEADKRNYWLDVRLRNEQVGQDSVLQNANAITLRSRLGYETDNYNGYQFLVEAENIFALKDDYNSTTNGNSSRSIVADPEDTEINRVYLSYTGFEGTNIKVGRQKLIFDNSRFVGNVGWRQNEQTFDAISISNQSLQDTTIQFAYIDKVRRIFGPDSSIGKTDMSSPMLNVTYRGFTNTSLTFYGYFLEFDYLPFDSNRTLGVRATGVKNAGDVAIEYQVEFADQQDYRDGSSNIDASYLHAYVTAGTGPVTLGLGLERLTGNGVYGFQTPLATGHAFNGWADLFLSTPANGIEDRYFSIGGSIEKFNLRAIYHDFKADIGSQNYGNEIDFIVTRKIGQKISAGLKFAAYTAEEHAIDTTKLWLFGQFRY